MNAFAVAIMAIGGTSTFLLAVLVFRRVLISANERAESRIESRIRPIALGFLDGDVADAPKLSNRDRDTFERLLTRYANQISGSKLNRVSSYFSATGAIDKEISKLKGARRTWRRRLAAQRLGAINATIATPALIGALEDKNFEVRRAAVRSLGRLAMPDATAGLFNALAKGQTPDALTLWALLQIGTPAIETARAILGDMDARIRGDAIRVIELLGSPSDCALISRLTHDVSPSVRSSAALALGRLGGAAELELLLNLLEDENVTVRRDACKALGRMRDRSAIASLVLHANNDVFEVAISASEAVFAIDANILTGFDPNAISSALKEARDLALIART